MRTAPVKVVHHPERLVGDDRRVIPRLLQLGDSKRRFRRVIDRVMQLSDDDVGWLLEDIEDRFAFRHIDIRAIFNEHFEELANHMPRSKVPDGERRLLVGAIFTMEYSIESAALLNPSMVLHPEQAGAAEGSARFLLSLRAIGEGHVSSIVFRRGTVDAAGEILLESPRHHAVVARPRSEPVHEKTVFLRRLRHLGTDVADAEQVLGGFGETFTTAQLLRAVRRLRPQAGHEHAGRSAVRDCLWLARADYELDFPREAHPAEMVIFPATANESHGMEDLRLVRFTDGSGETVYYGTYTAYDGWRVMPMLMETSDFRRFRVRPLVGRYARNKGAALFPRKIGRRYAMIGRHDGENLYLLCSRNVHVWNTCTPLLQPTEPWEVLQIGNCGSPLETAAGWLLLTHGVGPVREYCIGAVLLDLDEPSRVIGRLRDPLIVPTAQEREGYVPNVVYSCGAMIHGDHLFIPYAMSDSRAAIAVASVRELTDHLLAVGP